MVLFLVYLKENLNKVNLEKVENQIAILDSTDLNLPYHNPASLHKSMGNKVLVNYVNCDKKENDNSKIIVKGRKISECSDSSGIIFNNFY